MLAEACEALLSRRNASEFVEAFEWRCDFHAGSDCVESTDPMEVVLLFLDIGGEFTGDLSYDFNICFEFVFAHDLRDGGWLATAAMSSARLRCVVV